MGSTFTFSLRLRVPKETSGPGDPIEASADDQLLKGLRVLIADDNEVNVLVLTTFLQDWGLEVDVVTTGKQAVERVQERDRDLVLMDLRMPDLDGYAATRMIRSLPDPKLQQLPIFAVSASTRMGNQHELDNAGFTAFVGKPVSPDLLFGKIVRYVTQQATHGSSRKLQDG